MENTPYTPMQLVTQALKDILNAAANGEPYTPEELKSRFQNDYNVGYAALMESNLDEIA
jgi:hypothetical protein